MNKCVSCDKRSLDSVKFPCPKCKNGMMRCNKCRSLSVDYTCPKCGYRGP